MQSQLALPTVPRLGDRSAKPLAELSPTRLFRWDTNRPFGKLFPRGFEAFESHFGTDGLARIGEQGLEINIVCEKGALHFRDFFEAAKREFDRIAVWNVTGLDQRDSLLWLDFVAADLTDALTSERAHGWVWTREHQAACNAARERRPGARWKPFTDRERLAVAEAATEAMAMVAAHRSAAR